jgi:membrane-bound ClpP family serine protease
MSYDLLSYAILFLVTSSLGAVAMIAYNSRRQKTRTDDRPLIGSGAVVDKQLSPEGAVLVHGELWNACSLRGQLIPSQTSVIVVGMRGHILMVDYFRD